MVVIGRRGLHGGFAVAHDYRGVYGGRKSPTIGADVVAARPSWKLGTGNRCCIQERQRGGGVKVLKGEWQKELFFREVKSPVEQGKII